MSSQEKCDVYLSYTGRKTYLSCPKQYEYRYIIKEAVDRKYENYFFGLVIGYIFQQFYDKQLWANPNPIKECIRLIDQSIDYIVKSEKIQDGISLSFRENLIDDLKLFIPSGMETIRKNGFLSIYSKAEIPLNVNHYDSKHDLLIKIGGRADFIHGNSMDDIWIVDGKASKWRDKYIDSEQLVWYAVQFYKKFHKAPSRLGYIFWRFPEDPVSWIDFDEDSMRASLKQTVEVSQKIRLKQFQPFVSSECKMCNYNKICKDGISYLNDMNVKSNKVDISESDLIEEV